MRNMSQVQAINSKYSDVESVLMWGSGSEPSEITIAIPTYKRLELLKESLGSAINQDFNGAFNIVVVDNDDSGGDDVLEYISKLNNPKVRYFKNSKNIGMFGNWNRCIDLSNAKWISILNDDDLLDPEFLTVSYGKVTMLNADAVMVGSRQLGEYSFRPKSGMKLFLKKQVLNMLNSLSANRMLSLHDFALMSVTKGSLGILLRKEVAINLGGFREDYFPASDYKFWMEWLANGNSFYSHSKILSDYRIGVNESLKYETLIGFCVKGKEIRVEGLKNTKSYKAEEFNSLEKYFLRKFSRLDGDKSSYNEGLVFIDVYNLMMLLFKNILIRSKLKMLSIYKLN